MLREKMRIVFDVLAFINVFDWFLGGSRGAGVEGSDSDWDFCLLVEKKRLADATKALLAAGFVECDPAHRYGAEHVFRAFRKGDVNPLVFTDERAFDDTRKANEVCKALRLTRREDRVAVHGIVRDDELADTQRDTTDVGAVLDRVEALSEAVSMAANAVRDCLEAERRRAENLLPGAPASTYTQARIDKLEEGLAILDAVVKGEPKCQTRL